MVFKLLIVLAILILHTDAQDPGNSLPLYKWDLYGNDLLNLVYKREQENRYKCPDGMVKSGCVVVFTPRPTQKFPGKRTWGKLDLMKILRSVSRGESLESETLESNDYEIKTEK